ncbi:major facilitator superfamily domain-containing protein 6-like [Lytechinus variegatus]|uniref:major facilitator superfamily domain-containing protein 6-like n=1 Tax=Lytechinus variegatus TaxID=7654 RepID=UPI001BB262CD|nr:major facilitator superfamily domain-containing protein 6-like [Lytechinus variegatus]XP_041458782.1 major facilitator superfamily domain-containing protein 6-like [Lytechinus variegatus]
MACNINKDFLHIKLIYFTYLGAFACMLPYISVYLIHIGLSVWQVGIIRSLEPVLTFFFSPLWGGVADRYSKHRLATSIAIIGAAVAYFIFIFVPLMTGVSPDSLLQDAAENCSADTTEWNISDGHDGMCDDAVIVDGQGVGYDESKIDVLMGCTEMCAGMPSSNHGNHAGMVGYCLRRDDGWDCSPCPETENRHTEDIAEDSMTLYGISCASSQMVDLVTTGSGNKTVLLPSSVRHTENNVSMCQRSACCQCETKRIPTPRQGVTFAICTVFAILGVVFNCNILMFFDSLTMELIKGKKADYGKNRVWGAISWGLFAFLSGAAIDLYTDLVKTKTDRLEPAFIMYLFGMLACLAIFLHMKLPNHKKPEAMKKNLKTVLCDGEVILFLIVVVVTGISFILSFTYVVIFMKELGSPYLLLGLAVTLTAIAEIPFMYFSGAIIKRVGYAGVMYMTLIAYAIRYFGYSFVYNPWFILPVQLLHGITYGLSWPMFTAFANKTAPKGMASTLQSIVACCFMGFGAGVGNAVGGIIYENYGARLLFRCTGSLCLLTLVIFFFITVFVLRRKKKEEEANVDEEPEKCKMKDAPCDAPNWEDIERSEKECSTDEDQDDVRQNNINPDIHSVNMI